MLTIDHLVWDKKGFKKDIIYATHNLHLETEDSPHEPRLQAVSLIV